MSTAAPQPLPDYQTAIPTFPTTPARRRLQPHIDGVDAPTGFASVADINAALPRLVPGGNPVAVAREATGTWNAFAGPRPQSDGAQLVQSVFRDHAVRSPEFTGDDREDDGCQS